jgi:hypothetical protein
MQIQVTPYPAEILTADYRAAGTIHLRGNPAIFVNDNAVQLFTICDATLTPLATDWCVGQMNTPTLYVPKAYVQIMVLDELRAADVLLLPGALRLMVFTDTYAVRGTCRVGAETQPADLLGELGGAFLMMTGAEIRPLRQLAGDVRQSAELIFLHKSAVQSFQPR